MTFGQRNGSNGIDAVDAIGNIPDVGRIPLRELPSPWAVPIVPGIYFPGTVFSSSQPNDIAAQSIVLVFR